ncbi:hypothetical protein [Spirosoma validum]|uniref:Uncharacterized protein n=1 Tax=Spirosoma validum TaxID=2771355 RepID=A0A927B3T9_9BACT|nr:hypothetical protein [Spirosoma validum]MBD2755120.1 hypothetical protein [Spirosoma validum]
MFRPGLFIVLAVFLLNACSSGKTALKRGHFDLAVKKASQRLQQRPGLSKRGLPLATQVLQQAFVQAYQHHQTTIQRLSAPASTDAFRWEAVYREYSALQTLTDNARTCVTCADWLATYPVSYTDRQNDTRELAAADRYQAAEEAFSYREEDRLAAKDAYLNYLKAIEWVPDYRQARAKAADAFPFAILRVVVEPLTPSVELDRADNQELQRLLLRQVGQNTAPSTFVRLYPPDETAGDGYPIHQAIQMVIADYTPYRENTSSSPTTVYSNQAYKVGEKKINDSTKVDVMEKVKGTLTTYRREIQAGLDLRMRSIDTKTGKILWEESVVENRNWQTEWQTFSGDDRALNGHTLASANLFPPSRWQLYESMRDELADDVARRLRTKFSRD